MTLAISSRDTAVFRSVIKRLKWLSILLFTVLFFDMPLSLWMRLSGEKKLDPTGWLVTLHQNYMQDMIFRPLDVMLSIIFPIILALVIFYYLQSEKATTFFQSLAIRRRSLYLQSFFAGICMIWVPFMVAGFMHYCVFKIFGVNDGMWTAPLFTDVSNSSGASAVAYMGNTGVTVGIGEAMLFWLCLTLVMTLLFFAFTAFVGMFTGNILVQGGLVGIGLFLPLGGYYLIEETLKNMLYGFSGQDAPNVEFLSPISGYLSQLSNQPNDFWLMVAIYTVISLLLIVCGIWAYSRRHAEAAGETLSAQWVRGVFKYGVSFCGALSGGVYFKLQFTSNSAALYIGFIIGGLLGYIIADMVAYKTFRFYERWKPLLLFTVLFALSAGAIKLDFFGFERRVPDVAQIKSVKVIGSFGEGSMDGKFEIKSVENAKKVIMLQSKIISMKNDNTAFVNSPKSYNEYMRHLGDANYTPSHQVNINFDYKLVGGGDLRRAYTIDASKYGKYIRPILMSPEAKRSMYKDILTGVSDKILKIDINDPHFSRNITIQDKADKAAALEALQKDVMDVSYEALMEGREPQRASIEMAMPGKTKYDITYVRLPYYEEFKNFEAFLRSKGYYDRLVLDASDVSSLELRQVGSDRKIVVKDASRIDDILLWSSETDSEIRNMLDKGQPEEPVYYAVVFRKDGKISYMSMDGSYYPQKMIYEIFFAAN